VTASNLLSAIPLHSGFSNSAPVFVWDGGQGSTPTLGPAAYSFTTLNAGQTLYIPVTALLPTTVTLSPLVQALSNVQTSGLTDSTESAISTTNATAVQSSQTSYASASSTSPSSKSETVGIGIGVGVGVGVTALLAISGFLGYWVLRRRSKKVRRASQSPDVDSISSSRKDGPSKDTGPTEIQGQPISEIHGESLRRELDSNPLNARLELAANQKPVELLVDP
jgi:hypothetical protein